MSLTLKFDVISHVFPRTRKPLPAVVRPPATQPDATGFSGDPETPAAPAKPDAGN